MLHSTARPEAAGRAARRLTGAPMRRKAARTAVKPARAKTEAAESVPLARRACRGSALRQATAETRSAVGRRAARPAPGIAPARRGYVSVACVASLLVRTRRVAKTPAEARAGRGVCRVKSATRGAARHRPRAATGAATPTTERIAPRVMPTASAWQRRLACPTGPAASRPAKESPADTIPAEGSSVAGRALRGRRVPVRGVSTTRRAATGSATRERLATAVCGTAPARTTRTVLQAASASRGEGAAYWQALMASPRTLTLIASPWPQSSSTGIMVPATGSLY